MRNEPVPYVGFQVEEGGQPKKYLDIDRSGKGWGRIAGWLRDLYLFPKSLSIIGISIGGGNSR